MQPQDTLSHTLSTLHQLEQKINSFTRSDLWHPSHADLAFFIKNLTQKIATSFEEQKTPTEYKLLHYLQDHLQHISRKKEQQKVSLSLTQIAYIKLLLSFFIHLEEDTSLSPLAYQNLKYFQLAFMLCLLEDPQELMDEWHPLRHFFEQVLKSVRMIETHPCPRSLALLELVRTLLFEATLSKQPLRDSFAIAQKKFKAYLTQFYAELNELTQQHINTEHNRHQLFDVRKIVRDTLNDTLSGKHLPLFMIEFYYNVWQKYLYMSYLRGGIQGQNWKEGVEDMDCLAKSVVIKDPTELKQALHDKLDHVMDRVRSKSKKIYNGPEANDFFINIEKIHVSILIGNPTSEDFHWQQQKVTCSNESDQQNNPTHKLDVFHKDEWFRANIQGIISNILLIEKNERHNYLLFSDYSGNLTLRIKCHEFIDKFKQKWIIQLPQDPAFDNLFKLALPSLDRFIHETSALISKQESILSEKRRQNIASQIQKEAILNAEKEQKQSQLLEKKKQQQHFNRVLNAVNTLELGEILKITDNDKDAFICTLGLKLKSTRKLIFLDRNGRRLAEFLPEQLANKLIDGSATLIELDTISKDELDGLKWSPFSKHGKY